MEESTLQDDFTGNDTAISADKEEGMQDESSPAAADTVNVIDEVNANITITTTVFYILAQ